MIVKPKNEQNFIIMNDKPSSEDFIYLVKDIAKSDVNDMVSERLGR